MHEYKLVEGEQNWNVEHPKGIEAFERDDHWPPIIIAQDGLVWPSTHQCSIQIIMLWDFMDGMKCPPGVSLFDHYFFFPSDIFFGSSLFFLLGSLWFSFFSCHPWHHFCFGTPTYPSNLPIALPPTSSSTSLILLTPLLCLGSPPSPVLEIQWHLGLRL